MLEVSRGEGGKWEAKISGTWSPFPFESYLPQGEMRKALA
jgi:hypothetical protein